jgi:hypothetical protein
VAVGGVHGDATGAHGCVCQVAGIPLSGMLAAVTMHALCRCRQRDVKPALRIGSLQEVLVAV